MAGNNAGNAGNAGNTGGVGAVAPSTGVVTVFPDRVDLPFVTVRFPDPGGAPISTLRHNLQVYPDRAWTGDWRAWSSLSQYTAANPGFASIVVPAWPAADVGTELANLLDAARDERADALDEIVTQNEEFASYFLQLLDIKPGSYPKTMRLVTLASLVATFTVLHFKAGTALYQPRPRPSHICPALLPAVAVPGHPSYPSGHATESQLISLVLQDVLNITPVPGGVADARAVTLDALAWRIGRNREIAGVHYPSDGVAGRGLAHSIMPILKGIADYASVIADARAEWPA